jgi:uncharacterized protein (DUF1800 family)
LAHLSYPALQTLCQEVIVNSLLLLLCSVTLFSLSPEEAAHFLNRTQFGAHPLAMDALAFVSREEAVERLLRQPMPQPVAIQDWMREEIIQPEVPPSQWSEEDRLAFLALRQRQSQEMKAFLMGQALHSRHPFHELMTQFWHHHFTTEMQKVRSPHLMFRQDETIRRLALGSFSELLQAMAKDPAMMIYLDNVNNTVDAPNENFARELMELFTLGEGHYTENDVKELARTFTGWTVDPRTGRYRFNARLHDFGEKTILGFTGHWSGEQAIEILLHQEETAAFIARKFWRAFISPEPEEEVISYLADVFRQSDYDISSLMGALLTSDAFWDEENRGRLVKSPVGLVTSLFKQLNLPAPLNGRAWIALYRSCQNMGEDLIDPPNVKGYAGGTAWINTMTLPERFQGIAQLLQLDPQEPLVPNDILSLMAPFFLQEPDPKSFLTLWLLATDSANDITSDNPRLWVGQLLLDPGFHLK